MREIRENESRPDHGLAIVHSNRPEHLRRLVVEHFQRYPLAPLKDEVVLTESNGIGLWLQHALAMKNQDSQSAGQSRW